MAVTAFATGDGLTEKLWASDTIKLGMDRSFFEQNGTQAGVVQLRGPHHSYQQ